MIASNLVSLRFPSEFVLSLTPSVSAVALVKKYFMFRFTMRSAIISYSSLSVDMKPDEA